MKNKTNIIIISLLCLISFVACNEIFEKDLSDKHVELLAPFDSLKTIYSEHIFKWEEVHGAEWYNIRIVKPNFDRTELFLLDSNTIKTQYKFELEPGTYQWGIMAANYSTQTSYTVHTIIIDTNKVFANKRVELRKPNNIYYKNTNFLFNWNSIEEADKYRFEIRIDDWNSGVVYYAKDVFTDTMSINLPENNYYWGVNAYDSETNTSTAYTYKQLMVDTTEPNIPDLINPKDNDTIHENSVTLNWYRGTITGSPVYDSLFVSADTEFNNIVFSTIVTDTSYTIQPDNGTYYWRLKSFDRAGNSSLYSVYKKFIISD